MCNLPAFLKIKDLIIVIIFHIRHNRKLRETRCWLTLTVGSISEGMVFIHRATLAPVGSNVGRWRSLPANVRQATDCLSGGRTDRRWRAVWRRTVRERTVRENGLLQSWPLCTSECVSWAWKTFNKPRSCKKFPPSVGGQVILQLCS